MVGFHDARRFFNGKIFSIPQPEGFVLFGFQYPFRQRPETTGFVLAFKQGTWMSFVYFGVFLKLDRWLGGSKIIEGGSFGDDKQPG